MTQPLFDPTDFRIPPGIAHVCAGGETAFPRRHDDALRRYAEDKSNGMAGLGIAYWNRARQADWSPASAGWHSFAPGARGYQPVPPLRTDAMRFTRGNPAHAAVYVLNGALEYLAPFEMKDIQRHVQALTATLLERLEALQIPSTTPRDPARHGASVCIASPRAQAIVDDLANRGVWAWNGHGRVRFSFHGYNATMDIDRIVAAPRDI